jgi:hypothetical protein
MHVSWDPFEGDCVQLFSNNEKQQLKNFPSRRRISFGFAGEMRTLRTLRTHVVVPQAAPFSTHLQSPGTTWPAATPAACPGPLAAALAPSELGPTHNTAAVAAARAAAAVEAYTVRGGPQAHVVARRPLVRGKGSTAIPADSAAPGPALPPPHPPGMGYLRQRQRPGPGRGPGCAAAAAARPPARARRRSCRRPAPPRRRLAGTPTVKKSRCQGGSARNDTVSVVSVGLTGRLTGRSSVASRNPTASRSLSSMQWVGTTNRVSKQSTPESAVPD